MPITIKYPEKRIVVLKTNIEIVVMFCKALFDGKRPADHMNDMLIMTALIVAQLEGHPLNASKLADWVAMARPTVIRRLASLEKRGMVERRGLRFVASQDVANCDAVVDACFGARKLIERAAAQLSKLDSKAIARQPPAKL